MNQSVLDLLACPICRAPMGTSENGRVCRCCGERVHCYDFAKSGYLNLGGPRAGEGDSKEAVQARRAFLDAGYYQPLSDAINEMLDRISASSVLDAGCGEGYYTNRMAGDRAVLGVDLSRAGIDAAAKRAKQLQNGVGFAVASVFELPVSDRSLDVITNIFAPCAEEEFLRALRPGGHLLLVGAGERHLMGLKQQIYADAYENQGRADLPQRMEQVDRRRVHLTVTVEGQAMIEALFSMTPYYWRTSKEDHAKLAGLEQLTTELDFDIFLFRKAEEA